METRKIQPNAADRPATVRSVRRLSDALRRFRVYHRYAGLVLGFFVLVTGGTGILLGWKKKAYQRVRKSCIINSRIVIYNR